MNEERTRVVYVEAQQVDRWDLRCGGETVTVDKPEQPTAGASGFDRVEFDAGDRRPSAHLAATGGAQSPPLELHADSVAGGTAGVAVGSGGGSSLPGYLRPAPLAVDGRRVDGSAGSMASAAWDVRVAVGEGSGHARNLADARRMFVCSMREHFGLMRRTGREPVGSRQGTGRESPGSPVGESLWFGSLATVRAAANRPGPRGEGF